MKPVKINNLLDTNSRCRRKQFKEKKGARIENTRSKGEIAGKEGEKKCADPQEGKERQKRHNDTAKRNSSGQL